MRTMILTLLAALLVGTSVTREVRADAGRPVANGLTAEQRQKHLESFDVAWKTVRDAHYDPKLGGVNWQAVRDELRPRLEKAQSTDEARKVLQEMLKRLGHSHVAILPAELYTTSKSQAEPGFEVRMADGEAVVVRVSAGGPAAKAGVKPGWRVRKIDGEDLTPTLAKVRKTMGNARDAQAAQAYSVLSRLYGDVGAEVTVTFLSGPEAETTLALPLAKPRGNEIRQSGLPPVHVHFESRKLSDDIAYFSLSNFLDPVRVMPAFGDAVQKNLTAKGFILDLRGNGGGIPEMAQGMGGWFVDRPNLKLGTMTTRTTTIHAGLNPRAATYEGPLAILVDELSASTSEILAGGLQDLKRARVFGTRTAGACLTSQFVQLPNGDRMQYVVADYVSASGKRLESNGVEPDEVVPVDAKALLEGRDPALEAAAKWIRSQSGAKK